MKQVNQEKSIDFLILISSLELGGAETQAVNWAINLSKRNFKVEVMSFMSGILEDTLQKNNIPSTSFTSNQSSKIWKLFMFYRFTISIRKFLRKPKTKHVVGFLALETYALSLATWGRKPGVGIHLGRRADFGYGEDSTIGRYILNNIYNKCDAVFTNSKSNILTALNAGICENKIFLVNNFLRYDLPEISKLNIKMESIKSRIKILSVGNLLPVKNHLKIIDAIAIYMKRKNFTNVDLTIYGSGNLKKLLIRESNLKGIKLMLVDNSTNPWIEAKNYHVYIHASKTEGSSNAIWEAAACGFPIISTKVGDISTLKEICGETVLIANSDEQIEKALDYVVANYDDLRLKAAKNARKVRQLREPNRICSEILTMVGV